MRRERFTSWLSAAVFTMVGALLGCGGADEQPKPAGGGQPGPVAEKGTPDAQPPLTVPATTDPALNEPALNEPANGGVAATPETVGTKGKGYGGGIVTEPISQYFRIQDRLTLQFIEKGIKDFHALNNGRYPKSFDEFNEKIVKAQGLRLPELPPGASITSTRSRAN